jgi:AraC family transcriptional regulator of adaptative response/methylated-DNA-[protein]-cysteine methyltransferase
MDRIALVRDHVALSELETPLGKMLAGATEGGVCLVEYKDHTQVDDMIASPSRHPDEKVANRADRHLLQLHRQLHEYFARKRREFSISLYPIGTEFQKTVWDSLQRIPYGTTRSYLQQAMAMHRPDAVRAVAAANGANPIAILIPCHRVVGSKGELTGYGGGLWRKRWLLDFEQGVPALL